MGTKNRTQAPVRVLIILQLFVISSLVLAIVILLHGCVNAKTEGDRNALKQLQGQRVGLVVRALRYVHGDLKGYVHGDLKGGKFVQFGAGVSIHRGADVAVDAPLFAYGLAAHDSDNLKKELSKIFEVILIGEYVPINDENALNFDGELVLVNPLSQKLQVPFDEGTRSVMEKHSLKGIIFIDQEFYAFPDLSLIGCSSHVTIVDTSGRTVFQRQPGSREDGRARFSSFAKDFLIEFSSGLMGKATADEVDQSINNVSSQAAEAVRQAIEMYLLQE